MAGRTVGKHWPRSVRGDYAWQCDYCGIVWPRSKLVKDRKGLYVCPDEGPGEDEVALTEENQALTPVSYGKWADKKYSL